MRRTKKERETIITFNEEDSLAKVYTCNKKMRTKLDKAVETRPDKGKVVWTEKSDYNAVVSRSYMVPKDWIRIKSQRVMTPERLKDLMGYMRKATKNNPNIQGEKKEISDEKINKIINTITGN